MLFNSIPYIFCFLPITLIIYYILLKNRLVLFSKVWLVMASVAFYSWWDAKYTALLLASMLINFALGSSFNAKLFENLKNRKILLIFSVAFNILLLGYFKYMNFFIDNVNWILHTHIEISKIILPLGISFFTFTQIAYLVDAYKKEAKEYDFLSYMLFVTFFPHLIAGPILHHKEMMPQFDDVKRKVLRYKNIVLGLFLFTIGFFKKVYLADNFSNYVSAGFNSTTELSMFEGIIAMMSYTFQIYFDFSGYTDMALGSAKMLNIDLPLNFNSPYKAISVQDFWKRWHITLSRFLRDYIYIPLGGNRKGEFRTYINLLTTMLIGGLWHGASWLFVIWGAMHGIAQCIHKLYLKTNIKIPKFFAVLITFIFINLSWVVFRAENLDMALKIYKSVFNFQNIIIPKIHHLDLVFQAGESSINNILLMFPLGFILIFLVPNSQEIISKIKIKNYKSAIFYGVVFAVFFVICVLKQIVNKYSEFIYFNF